MSTEVATKYVSVTPSSQMTYVLDTTNLNMTQIQLAVPATEILLVQSNDKQQLVAEGNQIIGYLAADQVILLQPQEYIVVDGATVAEEEQSTTTTEDAKCWFRDSLITTAALSTLNTYVKSNAATKVRTCCTDLIEIGTDYPD